MLTNFKELEDYVLSRNMKKRIALANAHDEPALSAVVHAHRKGVVDGTLVGKKNEIIAMLHDMGENESDYEIVDFDGEELEAAKIAVQLVREGKADIPMKGILQTSNFARAILNKETGLIPKGGRRLVSQCGIFEYEGRFIMITDAAINIAPDVETQIGIVENALPVARALAWSAPRWPCCPLWRMSQTRCRPPSPPGRSRSGAWRAASSPARWHWTARSPWSP